MLFLFYSLASIQLVIIVLPIVFQLVFAQCSCLNASFKLSALLVLWGLFYPVRMPSSMANWIILVIWECLTIALQFIRKVTTLLSEYDTRFFHLQVTLGRYMTCYKHILTL